MVWFITIYHSQRIPTTNMWVVLICLYVEPVPTLRNISDENGMIRNNLPLTADSYNKYVRGVDLFERVTHAYASERLRKIGDENGMIRNDVPLIADSYNKYMRGVDLFERGTCAYASERLRNIGDENGMIRNNLPLTADFYNKQTSGIDIDWMVSYHVYKGFRRPMYTFYMTWCNVMLDAGNVHLAV